MDEKTMQVLTLLKKAAYDLRLEAEKLPDQGNEKTASEPDYIVDLAELREVAGA